MSKPDDGIHTVVNLTRSGELHITEHKADDCQVHGNGNAKGKSHTGSTEAYRLGYDRWRAQAQKANLN